MSNHAGSYMLNEVLQYLENDHTTSMGHAFRSMLNKDRAKFFDEILKIGRNYDCNAGEIMSFMGGKYGFCYCCEQNKEPPNAPEALSRHEEEFYVCEDCNKRWAK